MGLTIEEMAGRVKGLDRSYKNLEEYNQSKGSEHEMMPNPEGQIAFVYDEPPYLDLLVEEGCVALICLRRNLTGFSFSPWYDVVGIPVRRKQLL